MVCGLTALSSEEPGDEDVLDAGCLLDVLRLYRWHISSFEEQVRPHWTVSNNLSSELIFTAHQINVLLILDL